MDTAIKKLAIIIVTFKRQELLDGLLDSLLFLKDAPWRVFIIDNENSPETERIVDIHRQLVAEGLTEVFWPSGADSFEYVGMLENTGGAGGFSEGVKRAYRAGAEWFWVMDDDVEVAPYAISRLAKWTDRFDAIQGSRLDYDGGAFYWQYRFIEPLGMYDPLAPSGATDAGFRRANALCFEGALFSRKLVERIGPPDERFFIYWDDCIFGYLASKVGDVVLVDDVILKRSRDVAHWEVSGVRQLNSTSDMTRYHIMRNRGHMANYMKLYGDYNPITFGVGTILCGVKEVIRLVAIDRQSFASGMRALWKGALDGRKILYDKDWTPKSREDLS